MTVCPKCKHESVYICVICKKETCYRCDSKDKCVDGKRHGY